ncbi:putative protein phosphatase 2C 48 [Hibiscus syriacus]|uniref:protein-serine/threonine phosphatase n=1 Tax=Hibiscus syriacus TaxID=106335 RepID=A0A6A2XCA5_HIBSY|nr:putative protein phosphatase 2C 48 [Hibiscus syriacus]
MVKSCWNPSAEVDSCGRVDGLLWYKDLGQHAYGEFSMAVIQANSLLEDQSQLESGQLSSSISGPYGTFIGVYDGHGGSETSRYINDNLLNNLKSIAPEHQEMKQWHGKPHMASAGSCCLTGVICNGLLYIANAGDSRVVLGRSGRGTKGVKALQLSMIHNASVDGIREELRSLHPNDPQIIMMKHKVWRVKGLIQKVEFNKEPLLPKFRPSEPIAKAGPYCRAIAVNTQTAP